MTTKLPADDWQYVGSTSNTDFYVIDKEILAVLPHERASDNETSARESLAFQNAHWQKLGYRGAAVIFMDRVLAQDGGARSVYENESRGAYTTCFALVGETFFGKVTASVYTGLKRPAIPTQVFPSLADALPWIAESNKTRGGRI
jgi:hypothetical protein